ncbi:Ldh family oxidoreductase [Synoicihabitans lomoniglobus]|uniref:Ldh family oxidoreductase n=1 Tax=Synoicihabitans lomoniglobus TaxID=2909285 RepID=A0AAE9ZR44_9BACT|nr:Ldh family oxidoreductase [Opitutaceae bacterium LMO-M01]WED63675.1 Ldh family oxidoreductase [Opitutaceae bacterium LMO-M01]
MNTLFSARNPIGRVSPAWWGDFGQKLLVKVGVPSRHAAIVVTSLVEANLRGVDSHGMQMLLVYLQQLRAGGINPRASGGVERSDGVCLRYDGGNGLGQVVADRCVELVRQKVTEHGLAMVVARRSNHFGTGAWWAEKLARAGYIGIVMSNACPAVAPWQGLTPTLGTNPLCVAMPGEVTGARWLLDMATTTVALGKVSDALHRGESSIPASWGFWDEQGRPTTDPHAAQRGSPTPIGGYKGTGLAIMVELLTAGLSGGSMATELPVYRTGGDPLGISHTFIAVDPRRFLGEGEFESRVDRLGAMVKAAAPRPPHEEVLLAGEPEWRCRAERVTAGIPVPAELWRRFQAVANELGVETPPR